VAGFDEAWAAVNHLKDGEPVSPELHPLLRRVYADVLGTPADLAAFAGEPLRNYLNTSSKKGERTQTAGPSIFSSGTSEGWERDWTEQSLPDDFHDVLSLMGQALHDTIRTPNIAENFDCLPEQLLDHVRRLTPRTPVNE